MTTRRQLLRNAALATAALSTPVTLQAQNKYPRNLSRAGVEALAKELSKWDRWGADDQKGTVNLITPAKRKAAAALVRDGVSVSLAHEADTPKPGASADPNAAWKHTVTATPNGPEGWAMDTIWNNYHGFRTTHMD